MSNDPAALLDMAPPNKTKAENIFEELAKLSPEELAVRSQEGGQWHNCLLMLTKKLVEACFTDEQIHAQTDRLTTYGFTVSETRVEVQKMINGARQLDVSVFTGSEPEKYEWTSVADLKNKPIKPREWVVRDWIPRGQPTLLYGDGGTGKSLVAMQLQIAVALGQPWFGLQTTQGKSQYISAEDDEDELARRFSDILAFSFIKYEHVRPAEFLSLAGLNALFADMHPSSQRMVATGLFREVQARIERDRPVLVIVDTLADVYPADENNRALVRQFVQMLRKPAIEYNCAIVVLAHPSLSGMSSGRNTSGSTAWNNSVRSRISFIRDDEDHDKRILKLDKANYGRIGAELCLHYQDGAFVHDPASSALDFRAAADKAKRVFLELLEECLRNGQNVNANGSSTYAPSVFAKHANSERVTKASFKTAMQGLLAEGVIESEKWGRATRLVMSK